MFLRVCVFFYISIFLYVCVCFFCIPYNGPLLLYKVRVVDVQTPLTTDYCLQLSLSLARTPALPASPWPASRPASRYLSSRLPRASTYAPTREKSSQCGRILQRRPQLRRAKARRPGKGFSVPLLQPPFLLQRQVSSPFLKLRINSRYTV